MTEQIIPLQDAPPPQVQDQTETSAAQPVTARTFTPDPVKTLELKPQLVEAVSKVFDPEIPVNIYELGLVYGLDVDSANNARVRMTLTAPACPAAQTLPVEVERRVREVAGINDVKVEVVWDPPWTRDSMSDAAKLTLGIF